MKTTILLAFYKCRAPNKKRPIRADISGSAYLCVSVSLWSCYEANSMMGHIGECVSDGLNKDETVNHFEPWSNKQSVT